MREHMGLYRGKRIDNGEWAEGYLLSYEDGRARVCARLTDIFCYEKDSSIIQTVAHEVDPDTVGECTGLRDKNGKLIFERDIVKTHYANAAKCDFVETVVFHNGKFCAEGKLAGNGKSWAPLWDGVAHVPFDKTVYMDSVEIIGNIHDNPELLKGGEGDG